MTIKLEDIGKFTPTRLPEKELLSRELARVVRLDESQSLRTILKKYLTLEMQSVRERNDDPSIQEMAFRHNQGIITGLKTVMKILGLEM